jgi:hypothetical protein
MPTPAWDVSLREWGLETLRPGMMLRLSVAGLAVELLIAARTLAPGAPLLPQWPQFLLVPLIFVIHFSSILRVQSSGRRRLRWRELAAEVPPVFVAAAVVYEHARVLEQRIFTLGPSIFFTLGVLVHYPRRGVAAGAFA